MSMGRSFNTLHSLIYLTNMSREVHYGLPSYNGQHTKYDCITSKVEDANSNSFLSAPPSPVARSHLNVSGAK